MTSGDPCDAIQTITSAQRVRLGFTKSGSPFITGGSVQPGTQVMLFEEMRYDVAASTTAGVSGSWIRRMAGYSGSSANMQPMAGPVPVAGALRFTYVRADGTTPAATPAQIRKIGIDVVTQSRAVSNVGGVSTPQQVDSVRTDIYLRNIPG